VYNSFVEDKEFWNTLANDLSDPEYVEAFFHQIILLMIRDRHEQAS